MTDTMRIILTNRCQYQCFYCGIMECQKDAEEMPFAMLMQYVRTAVANGVTKFEIAGGEPLLSPRIIDLVSALKLMPAVKWVSLTTNGILLKDKLQQLMDAGLDGVNIHLDTTLAQAFTEITKKSELLNSILEGIWYGVARDMKMVITVALHAKSIKTLGTMAGLAKKFPVQIRFVDIGEKEVILNEEVVLEILRKTAPFEKIEGTEEYKAKGWSGTIIFRKGIHGAFGMEHALELRLV